MVVMDGGGGWRRSEPLRGSSILDVVEAEADLHRVERAEELSLLVELALLVAVEPVLRERGARRGGLLMSC